MFKSLSFKAVALLTILSLFIMSTSAYANSSNSSQNYSSQRQLKTIDGQSIGIEYSNITMERYSDKNETTVTVTDSKKYSINPNLKEYRKIYKDNVTKTVYTKKNDGSISINGNNVSSTSTPTTPSSGLTVTPFESAGPPALCFYDNHNRAPLDVYFAACYQHYSWGAPSGSNVSKNIQNGYAGVSDYKLYVNQFASNYSSYESNLLALDAASAGFVVSTATIAGAIIAGGIVGIAAYNLQSSNTSCDQAINNAYNVLNGITGV